MLAYALLQPPTPNFDCSGLCEVKLCEVKLYELLQLLACLARIAVSRPSDGPQVCPHHVMVSSRYLVTNNHICMILTMLPEATRLPAF